MTVVAALLLVVAGVCRAPRSRSRLPVRRGPAEAPPRRGGRAPAVAVTVVGVASVLVVFGLSGLLVAATAALLVVVRRARRPVPEGGDAALTLEVLAACFDAGASPAAAARAGAGTGSSAVGDSLLRVAAALDRGDDPVEVWARAATATPELLPAARACRRTAVTGAAVADELRRAAVAVRGVTAAERRRRVERASVWIVLPLGLCFLPAFVLVGVAPLVVPVMPGLLR